MTYWRRTTETGYGHTVFVRPPERMPHGEWSDRLERRALLEGRIAVIGGCVIEPGTQEAVAAIAKARSEA